MKNITVTFEMDNPENMNILIQNYTTAAVKIILNKIPKNLLNNFIEQIETKEVMDLSSL